MSVSSSVVLPTEEDSFDDLSISSSVVDAILANLSAASSEAVYGIGASGSDLESVQRALSNESAHDRYGTEAGASVMSIASSKGKLSVKSNDRTSVKSLDKLTTVEQRQPEMEARENAASPQRDDTGSVAASLASSKASNSSSVRSKGSTSSLKRRGLFVRSKKKSIPLQTLPEGRPPRHDVQYTSVPMKEKGFDRSLADSISTKETRSTSTGDSRGSSSKRKLTVTRVESSTDTRVVLEPTTQQDDNSCPEITDSSRAANMDSSHGADSPGAISDTSHGAVTEKVDNTDKTPPSSNAGDDTAAAASSGAFLGGLFSSFFGESTKEVKQISDSTNQEGSNSSLENQKEELTSALLDTASVTSSITFDTRSTASPRPSTQEESTRGRSPEPVSQEDEAGISRGAINRFRTRHQDDESEVSVKQASVRSGGQASTSSELQAPVKSTGSQRSKASESVSNQQGSVKSNSSSQQSVKSGASKSSRQASVKSASVSKRSSASSEAKSTHVMSVQSGSGSRRSLQSGTKSDAANKAIDEMVSFDQSVDSVLARYRTEEESVRSELQNSVCSGHADSMSGEKNTSVTSQAASTKDKATDKATGVNDSDQSLAGSPKGSVASNKSTNSGLFSIESMRKKPASGQSVASDISSQKGGKPSDPSVSTGFFSMGSRRESRSVASEASSTNAKKQMMEPSDRSIASRAHSTKSDHENTNASHRSASTETRTEYSSDSEIARHLAEEELLKGSKTTNDVRRMDPSDDANLLNGNTGPWWGLGVLFGHQPPKIELDDQASCADTASLHDEESMNSKEAVKTNPNQEKEDDGTKAKTKKKGWLGLGRGFGNGGSKRPSKTNVQPNILDLASCSDTDSCSTGTGGSNKIDAEQTAKSTTVPNSAVPLSPAIPKQDSNAVSTMAESGLGMMASLFTGTAFNEATATKNTSPEAREQTKSTKQSRYEIEGKMNGIELSSKSIFHPPHDPEPVVEPPAFVPPTEESATTTNLLPSVSDSLIAVALAKYFAEQDGMPTKAIADNGIADAKASRDSQNAKESRGSHDESRRSGDTPVKRKSVMRRLSRALGSGKPSKDEPYVKRVASDPLIDEVGPTNEQPEVCVEEPEQHKGHENVTAEPTKVEKHASKRQIAKAKRKLAKAEAAEIAAIIAERKSKTLSESKDNRAPDAQQVSTISDFMDDKTPQMPLKFFGDDGVPMVDPLAGDELPDRPMNETSLELLRYREQEEPAMPKRRKLRSTSFRNMNASSNGKRSMTKTSTPSKKRNMHPPAKKSKKVVERGSSNALPTAGISNPGQLEQSMGRIERRRRWSFRPRGSKPDAKVAGRAMDSMTTPVVKNTRRALESPQQVATPERGRSRVPRTNGEGKMRNFFRSRSRSRSKSRSKSMERQLSISRSRSRSRSKSLLDRRGRNIGAKHVSFKASPPSVVNASNQAMQDSTGGDSSAFSLDTPTPSQRLQYRIDGNAEYVTRYNIFACPPTTVTKCRKQKDSGNPEHRPKRRRPVMDACCQCMYEIFVEDLFQCEEPDDNESIYTRDATTQRTTNTNEETTATQRTNDDESSTRSGGSGVGSYQDEGYYERAR